MTWVDLLGWCATAVFVASYFATKPEVMRRVQMAGALLWVAYGVALPAMPVIAANLLVVSAAAWTARRPRRDGQQRRRIDDQVPSSP